MGMVWVATLADDNQVASLRQQPDAIYDFVNSEAAYKEGRQIDLDKEWHATHFLLTGSAGAEPDPLSLIIGMYENIGPDHGYGPAWLIPAEAIKACDEALQGLDNCEFASRYDPEAMRREHVYLADLYADEGDEGLQFLLERVDQLREFVRKGAASSLNAFALIT